ncbi:hypothetical protein AB1K32_15125 [Metabacillus dongyingensis]|uniref:hypothetical protein n=1 Tax=Metabacillus dongyingensis TaxID=2874282 RepID=UPI003B8E3DA2
MTWDEQKVNSLKVYKEQGLTVNEIIEKMSEEYQEEFTYWSITKKLGRLDHTQHPVKNAEYKETIEIQPDGSHKSDKLLKMSANECKDVNYLLKAHGYDVNEWELISAKNNIWNSYSKQDGVMTLYSSKISVKPKVNGTSIEQLVEAIKKTPQITFPIEPLVIKDKRMLEIPLYDSHFGISDYEYYKLTQAKIMDQLLSRKWEEVLFIIGQDTLHTDNFKGQTANGTLIGVIDLEKAWNDCRTFYEPLLEEAIKQSNSVKVMYSKGNHDESMSWAFVQLLKAKYPQVSFDDSMVERKAHVFGSNFIGVTHGDKARKNLHNIFPVEFPNEWSKAKNREIHIGHIHVEDGKDHFGMMVRTLATRNKTDKWHKDNGFVGAHKRFMLFEYSEEELESIHYV